MQISYQINVLDPNLLNAFGFKFNFLNTPRIYLGAIFNNLQKNIICLCLQNNF